MFPKMRRHRQQLPQQDCIDILQQNTHGVLALQGENGYPYALPLSYVYYDGKLIFHGADTGYKVECLQHCDKVSFCVVDKDQVVSEQYTTHYRSAIAFGTVRMLTEFNDEMIRLMMPLAAKYRPKADTDAHKFAIEKEKVGLCVYVMEIEHLTGKASKD